MRGLVLVALLAVIGVQGEPYPGQGSHAEPPAGWFCQHQNYELSIPPAHTCVCERTVDPDSGRITEDPGCTVWCHADHCHCRTAGHQ